MLQPQDDTTPAAFAYRPAFDGCEYAVVMDALRVSGDYWREMATRDPRAAEFVTRVSALRERLRHERVVEVGR